MQKMGWFGGVQGALKVNGNAIIRQSAYDFLFDFNRNHASILYRFRDVPGYLLKVADFDPPHLHSAPRWGVTPIAFRKDLWHPKTEVPGRSWGVVCVILCSVVFVKHRLVTNRQTDTGPLLVPRMHSKHSTVISCAAIYIIDFSRISLKRLYLF